MYEVIMNHPLIRDPFTATIIVAMSIAMIAMLLSQLPLPVRSKKQ